jgi:hypothetical protein
MLNERKLDRLLTTPDGVSVEFEHTGTTRVSWR